jgi:hypothetical protein
MGCNAACGRVFETPFRAFIWYSSLPSKMAPKRSMTSSPKKRQTTLKQATLTFKHTKRGAAAFSKAKSKSISRAKSEADNEGENDSENILIQNSGSEDEEGPSVIKEPLDMQDRAGAYNKYYREVKKKMGNVPPSEFVSVTTSFHSHCM